MMWEDFLCDPVKAAFVIFGLKLDAFQSARLRYYWWVPKVIDSSGFSSGKTIVDWAFANLRCLLLPDQAVGVYYPVFETGKNSFWQYYRTITAPIFRAQMGRMDEEGAEGNSKTEGSACFKAFFRNGNTLFMPAPSFMKAAQTQASLRFNTLLVEEWTHIDAGSTGIDDQLIGRVTRPSWNQHHPIWGNHLLFTAPAKTRMHPGARRLKASERRVKRGAPDYACLSYSYKDYSDRPCHTGKSFAEEYRIHGTIETKKNVTSRGEWLGEGLGIWGSHATGWFTEEAIQQAVAHGRARNVVPVLGRAMWESVHAQAAGKTN